VLGAIVGSSIAAAQPTPAPTVPLLVPLLVIDAPSTFELARLANALDTYVPNAKLAVTAMSSGTEPPPGCEQALAAARTANSPIGLWLHWTVDGGLVIERVGEAGCSAVESSTVDVPPAQPAFVYRVVALKIASLVHDVPARQPQQQAPAQRPVSVIAVTNATSATSPLPWRAIDLGASGIADTGAADRVYFASAGAWFGRTWALGGDVRVSFAHDASGPGGDGSARVFGAFAGVRRAIVDRGVWAIDVSAELGAIGVHGSATRTGTSSAMTDDVWTPAAALAPRIRFAVVGPVAIAFGPTLELLARPVELDLGVSPLYHAGRVRLRADVHVELTF
jgi:hypothetical protein